MPAGHPQRPTEADAQWVTEHLIRVASDGSQWLQGFVAPAECV